MAILLSSIGQPLVGGCSFYALNISYPTAGSKSELPFIPGNLHNKIRQIGSRSHAGAFAEQKKLNRMLGKNGFYEVDGYRNFVFLNANGRLFTVSLFNAALGRMVKRYNGLETETARKAQRDPVLLPHISNHILRHTGCTRMAESGMDPKVLQTIMGHSDIAVTMRIYNHVDQERIEREMKKMEYAI
ncbi:MAG: tyrosine-type recombinase/integrase [Lachnospiraceae bacterium]|nr:tyrosine-type recombinase/integrase [Lachnospiraceae bacterium]